MLSCSCFQPTRLAFGWSHYVVPASIVWIWKLQSNMASQWHAFPPIAAYPQIAFNRNWKLNQAKKMNKTQQNKKDFAKCWGDLISNTFASFVIPYITYQSLHGPISNAHLCGFVIRPLCGWWACCGTDVLFETFQQISIDFTKSCLQWLVTPHLSTFFIFEVWVPKIDCFPSYFNQEMYRFLGDWWAGATKGHIQIDLSSLSTQNSKLDFTQESKYYKVIPKCSHGKLRITRHNDRHLGYGISLGKRCFLRAVGGFDEVQIPPRRR